MSEMTTPPRSGPKLETVLIGLFVALVVGVLLYLSGQRQQELRTSPIGLNGLQVWLSAQEQETQVFTGGWNIDADDVGLLVLPLHDTRPSTDREVPRTKEELLFQQDEYDVRHHHIRSKAELVQTLIVLPKWRTGMRLTGLAHPALLVEEQRPGHIVKNLFGVKVGGVARIRRPFSEFSYAPLEGDALTARLYVAQVFEGKGCTPIIGEPGAMVLGKCPLRGSDEHSALVLSDPDFLSNHGLRLGDNAAIAADILPTLAAGERILIDYSRRVWIVEDREVVKRERTWEDLMRFFEYPFSVLWLGAAMVMAIILWRSGLRYGPVLGEKTSQGAAKLGAIRARARLLRLTGQDGALLSDYAAARIAAKCAATYGAVRPAHLSEEEAFLTHITRRAPDLAQRLTVSLEAIRRLPAHTPPSVAITYVEDLESLLEQTAHVT